MSTPASAYSRSAPIVGTRLRRTDREDDVHTKSDKLLGKLRETLLSAFRVAPLNEKVLAFDVAMLAKSLLKCR